MAGKFVGENSIKRIMMIKHVSSIEYSQTKASKAVPCTAGKKGIIQEYCGKQLKRRKRKLGKQ